MNQGLAAYFEKSDSHSRMSDMNVKELKNLVRQGEGTSLEFVKWSLLPTAKGENCW
jgi:hypothetical protein